MSDDEQIVALPNPAQAQFSQAEVFPQWVQRAPHIGAVLCATAKAKAQLLADWADHAEQSKQDAADAAASQQEKDDLAVLARADEIRAVLARADEVRESRAAVAEARQKAQDAAVEAKLKDVTAAAAPAGKK